MLPSTRNLIHSLTEVRLIPPFPFTLLIPVLYLSLSLYTTTYPRHHPSSKPSLHPNFKSLQSYHLFLPSFIPPSTSLFLSFHILQSLNLASPSPTPQAQTPQYLRSCLHSYPTNQCPNIHTYVLYQDPRVLRTSCQVNFVNLSACLFLHLFVHPASTNTV